ncbi:response regulator [Corallococcus sp. M34]|uniref:response regulator n=1 Tax=Citreicoccus inhibens TaxID=2849499 RepID=UPI0018F415B1|nr:response regulator [Citreicoccus inhibens]MBJ6763704.1 response regulator [Myxococcaceae bacterium JPH2]MBU8897934.1 response regulator [Citreicoccus inhibens]
MRRKKVLLVDDSSTVLLLHRLMLMERGYDTITARDGMEALELAAVERPDLVFLDVVMPHLDGLETCRMLRDRDPTRLTPIVLCSSRAEPNSVRAGFDSGCSDYLAMPFIGDELTAVLHRYLDG